MIVLVTGATSGFDEEMARKLVKMGNKVIATGRRRERLDGLVAELGSALLPLAMDVGDKASVTNALDFLAAEWRDIDVLINNAGLALGIEPAQRASLEDWETMTDTLPSHVNINHLEMMPTCQGFSTFTIKRHS